MPDTATFVNGSGAAKTVFVIVDSINVGEPSEFSLDIQIQ